MKIKITFTYFKDTDKQQPSTIFDHFQFIGRIIKELEQIEVEPYWSIENVDESEKENDE